MLINIVNKYFLFFLHIWIKKILYLKPMIIYDLCIDLWYVHIKAVSNCQRIMKACGLLQALCNILMASGVPADVLTETINTVAEVIRGNSNNQEFLAGVMAPSNPPRYFHSK